jgi:hypothetical protein
MDAPPAGVYRQPSVAPSPFAFSQRVYDRAAIAFHKRDAATNVGMGGSGGGAANARREFAVGLQHGARATGARQKLTNVESKLANA